MNKCEILEDIRKSYRDLQSPDYGFVNAAVRGDKYLKIFNNLSSYGNVTDVTDLNDDVAFFWLLKPEGYKEGFLLQLSMVGKYAVVVDLERSQDSCTVGKNLVRLLKSFGFYVFSYEELFEHVCDELPGGNLYSWLFSDVGMIPVNVISE
ncbi:hypothetical protein [Paracidovorax oryzae]|uniref:hypothetical protein n=1 Tax=Paracidovorax oryzae TaxID=862720 RepID=UPI0012EC1F49|nr:hypothetical protein [Paracidovorax oryzae]